MEHRALLIGGHCVAWWALPRLACLLGGIGFTRRALLARAGLATVFLPLAFSEMGLLLPALNPTPYEWHALVADWSLLGGRDVWEATETLRRGWLPDLLMACYSTFYLLPLVLFVHLVRRRELEGGREVLVTVTFGFCASYLLYLVFPVLWPSQSLNLDPYREGGALLRTLLDGIDSLEMNKRDCFPSGHTWLTLTVLHLAWWRGRRLFWALLPVAAGLLLATVTLRFHFLVDVLAGAILYYPSLRMARWLDREGGAWCAPRPRVRGGAT